jgi:uncharacterized protein GlcG (DUF336 family)
VFDDVKKIAELAETAAEEHGVPVVVTIIDVHGNTMLMHRMTGSPVIAIEISRRKAYTAAVFGVTTESLMPLVQPGGPLFTLTAASGGELVAFGGGVPVNASDGTSVGLGISGGTTEQDIAIATAAASAFADALVAGAQC